MALHYGPSRTENLLHGPDMSQRGLRGPWLILVHIVGSGISMVIGLGGFLLTGIMEIDIIVNRTLVYGILTGLLAILYLGSILLVQQVLHSVLPEGSDLILIGLTLAVVWLFQPLQRHIQRVIDHRFYRQKYDAQQTLTILGDSLRHEVDLVQLRKRLEAVVEETMQPTHVSLWVRPGQYVHEAPKYTRHLRL